MPDFQASTEYRGSFRRGDVAAIILRLTETDGTPLDPESITVYIESDGGLEVVYDEDNADKIKEGAYVVEWDIDDDQEAGKYLVQWVYEVEGVEYTKTDSIFVSAESATTNRWYEGRILLLRQSLELMIDCAQSIPVYFQEPKITKDRQSFFWTKGRWNPGPCVTVYRNQNAITDGFTVDYGKGSVIFDTPLTEHDVVNADYNFRWFSDEQLDRFLSNGLHMLNAYPPHTAHTLISLPDKYIPVVLYAAAVDALRAIMFCINFQEPSQFFGGREGAQQAFGQFDTLKKNYEETLIKFLENKKFGPYAGLTKAVVVPEYTLPGGRSRWFRYLFSGGV